MRRLSLKSTLFGVDPDKRLVYADNPNVEIYKKQRNNRGLPQENETNTTNGLRLSKL